MIDIFANLDPKLISSKEFISYIEISKGSKNKYEFDKKINLLRLDRVLYTSTTYPHNYGFIPLTLSQDGDPLDVLVLSSEPIVPNAIVNCYPIGVLFMKDQGKLDEKIIAVSKNDPNYNIYKDINDLPSHILEEISHFFKIYKELENKQTVVDKIYNKKKAIEVIEKSIKRFNKVK